MTRLTAKEVANRVSYKHNNRFALVQETYVNTKVKAWFYDTQKQEWFYTCPEYVLQGCGNPSDRASKIKVTNTPMLQKMGRARAKYVSTSGQVLAHLCNQYGVSQSTYQKLAKQTSTDFAIKAFMTKLVDGKYTKYQSNLEVFALELLKDQVPDIQKWNKKPLEDSTVSHHPDFRLVGNKVLYVDVHGLFFHSEYHVTQNYHQRRAVDFQNCGLTYIQFFADEIYEKSEIVKSMIFSKLGKVSDRYSARKLELKLVTNKEAVEFFNTNHLMGWKQGTTVGLFDKELLVAALTFKCYKDKIEIDRFATLLNSSCAGGFGKLVSYLKQFNLPIVSFCDLRYSDGHSYRAVGFTDVGTTLGWCWTNGAQRYNRRACIASPGKTEKENAQEKGWFKIYDAGQRKYVLDVASF